MEDAEVKKKKPFYKKWWFVLFVLIVLIIAISNCGKKDTSTGGQAGVSESQPQTKLEKALEGAEEVDYKTLHKDYMDNAIRADAKYKDKMLILTGQIKDIDREIAGNPYVTFEVGFLENVRITFDKSEEEKVAELSKGQTIKIVGKCKGTLLSTSVAMDDCLLVE